MLAKKCYWLMMLSLLLLPFSTTAQATPVEDQVAVLITGWGMPAGYNFNYAWTTSNYPRIGDKTPDWVTSEAEEAALCKIGHVGEWGQRSHIGMLPWMITFEVAGYEEFWDYTGIYIFEGGVYKSPNPAIAAVDPGVDIPAGTPIVPLKDVLDHTGSLSYPVDSRTGEDHLDGWYRIGDWDNPFSNGIHDLVEGGPPYYKRLHGIIGQPADPAEALEPVPAVQEQDYYLEHLMDTAFGDRIDMRYGNYTAVKDDNGTSITKMHDDVAEEFADEGFTKMLLARETTDFNNYALEFMTGNYVKERLCELGKLDSMEIHMSRQVGRTPEFNTMNIINLRPYIESFTEGSTIAIIYVTRGLTWGKKETTGLFGSPHPWSKEVYHDNAYLNYLSLKKALRAEFGGRYDLVFTHEGIETDLREDNFYTYGLGNDVDLKGYGGETVFASIRDKIQQAKADGIDKMIIVPGHWNYDNLDTILRMKELNDIPLPPKSNLEAGIFEWTHCEPAGSWNATSETWDGIDDVACDDPTSVATIIAAPSYSYVSEEFAVSYYVMLRGALEKFGLFPYGEEPDIDATRMVAKLSGGIVTVTDPTSPIAGASIAIPADPYPGYPEGFTWEAGLPDTAVPINDPADTNDCMWEDTHISIGFQASPPAMTSATSVGPAVHIGPYRTIFNRDVTITVPYDSALAGTQAVNVYIYNHITESWDAIAPDVVNPLTGTVTFTTQVLGLFQAAAANPTLISLSSFTATPDMSSVLLSWSTESESNNAGFNIYRAHLKDGPYVKINKTLIPAWGSLTRGAAYEFLDKDLLNVMTYYYKLEDIDNSGAATLHGPVKATPRWIYGLR